MRHLLCASACVCSVLQARVEKGSSFNHWIVRGTSFCRHTAFFNLFFIFTDMQLHCYNCFSSPEEHVFFRWTVAALVLKETEVLCESLIFSQQHKVRKGNAPSQTSSSSGRWSEWQGVKVGSHRRTPPSDVARAATALVCGRKAPQARCDSSNKVGDLRCDRCEWDQVKIVKVVFIFSPQNPKCVSTNSTCAIDHSWLSHREDAVIVRFSFPLKEQK